MRPRVSRTGRVLANDPPPVDHLTELTSVDVVLASIAPEVASKLPGDLSVIEEIRTPDVLLSETISSSDSVAPSEEFDDEEEDGLLLYESP